MKLKLSSLHLKLFSSLIVIAWTIILWSNQYLTFFIQTIMGLSLCYLYLTYLVWKKTDWLIGISFCYFTISQLPRIFNLHGFYSEFDAASQIAFQTVHAQGLMYLTAVSLFIVFNKHTRLLKKLFINFLIVDVFVMLARFLYGSKPWFLFNNPAIDASFLACMLPLTFNLKGWKRCLPFLTIIACICTNSSTAVAGVGLGLGCYFLSYFKFSKKAVCTALSLCLSSALGGYLLMGRILIDSSGRYHVWRLGFDYWRKYLNVFTGAGTGSFAIYGPTLQMIEAFKLGQNGVEGFFWMHNDWLQIMFENGLIGFLLVAGLWVRGLYRLRNNPALFSSLVVFGVTAAIQMHMRHILLTMLGAWLIHSSCGTLKHKTLA